MSRFICDGDEFLEFGLGFIIIFGFWGVGVILSWGWDFVMVVFGFNFSG